MNSFIDWMNETQALPLLKRLMSREMGKEKLRTRHTHPLKIIGCAALIGCCAVLYPQEERNNLVFVIESNQSW